MSPPPATRPPSVRLNREILALALPSFFSNISVPLLGIADTALVGHLGDVAFLGAVALGAILFDTLYWAFGFLRMGTTALVAQAYGAGNDRRAGEVLAQSAVLALAVGATMLLARQPLTDLGLELAGGTDDVRHWARAYVLVRIWSAPAVLLTYALNGFFRGMKDAVTPLVVTVLVNGLNIVGDILLIYGKLGFPRLGVVGAAWASLAAAWIGVAFAIGVTLWRYGAVVRLTAPDVLSRRVLSPGRLKRLATTHTNLFFRTLLLMGAYFIMMAAAARLGEVALAANAVVLQLWHIAAYSVDGVAFAAETLIGNALGAGATHLTRRLVRRALVWGVALASLYSLAYLAWMRSLAGFFTVDQSVIDAVASLTLITAAALPINAAAFIYDGVFIGANDMRYLFLQMTISFALVFVPAVLVLLPALGLGLGGLWSAMALFMVARAVTLHWRCRQPSWLAARLAAAQEGA